VGRTTVNSRSPKGNSMLEAFAGADFRPVQQEVA